MDIYDAIILGVVEGITEFLPISSTAHLILAGNALAIPATEFFKSFEIAIQLGAILAVITLYFKLFLNIKTLKNIAAGFIPTAILGLVFYSSVKSIIANVQVVLLALFIGGVLLIIFEIWHKKRVIGDRTTITLSECMVIGLCQAFAFIPGVSRAAATIVGGLILGISRMTITEYSFLLAVPTMAAATGFDLIKNRESVFVSGNLTLLVVGLLVSYIVAMIAIKFLLAYLRKHDFTVFGVYRILIAIIVFLALY